MTKIGISLAKETECELVYQLSRNANLFVWSPYDIPGIDIRVVCHHLAIDPFFKEVAQRKQKVDNEKKVSISEEVGKLSSGKFIMETKYHTWLAKVVLVTKVANKWHICMDLIEPSTVRNHILN